MPIVENVAARNQQDYGRIFKPRADQSRFRSHFAVVEGTDTGAFDDGRDIQENGLRIGKSGATLRFEPWKGPNGEVNKKSYGGRTIQEFVVPIEEAREKERREGKESSDELDAFLGRQNVHNRTTDSGLSGMEASLSTNLDMRTSPDVDVPVGPKATSVQGWTPERRARQMATIAAKKSQTQPTT